MCSLAWIGLFYPLCAQAMVVDASCVSPAKTGTVGRPQLKRKRTATANVEDSGLSQVSGEGLDVLGELGSGTSIPLTCWGSLYRASRSQMMP